MTTRKRAYKDRAEAALALLDFLGDDLRRAYGFETDHIGLKSAEKRIEEAKRHVKHLAAQKDHAEARIKRAQAALSGRE
jgi:hypothetical protein